MKTALSAALEALLTCFVSATSLIRRAGRLLLRGACLVAPVVAIASAASLADERLSGRMASAGDDEPHTYALLLNGGGSAATNYASHFHHLQAMMGALRARGIPAERISVFCSDGENPAADMAVRDATPKGFWLLEGTELGRLLTPSTVANTVWDGVDLRPARKSELRQWFARMGRLLRPGDTLFVFVTDHGTRNAEDPANGSISLWNESLSVLEFRALLAYLPQGVRAITLMSQCFSGAFADAMIPPHAHLPDGSVCGFFSTTQERPSYGCYPDREESDRTGHAVKFIEAMGRHGSCEDAHASVLVSDRSPDVPLRTSDLFLERLLADEASEQQEELEEMADESLAHAWETPERWEPAVRLLDRIGEVYGVASGRSLAELAPEIEKLQSLASELATYERRWKIALDDLRREHLDRFLEENEAWARRLDKTTLEGLDQAAKKTLAEEALQALELFSQGHPELRHLLETMHAMRQEARSAKYRIETRLAALLRMRALLIRIAAIDLLEGDRPLEPGGSHQRRPAQEDLGRALSALKECERTTIGAFDASREARPEAETPARLPPLSEDLAIAARVAPSWLGVRYKPVSEKDRDTLGLLPGATVVEEIYERGPAARARMKPDDIILGPPGAYFSRKNQIREWTMTAPRNKALPLDILRKGRKLRLSVTLVPYPTTFPEVAGAPQAGEKAPPLGRLTFVRQTGTEASDLAGRRHMLFFWATWCPACKRALPDLMAWSRQAGVPVLAVTDEDEQKVEKFLEGLAEPLPDAVAVDKDRSTHREYGISGTPTFVLVDERGVIEWRHVGYTPDKEGISLPGWPKHAATH